MRSPRVPISAGRRQNSRYTVGTLRPYNDVGGVPPIHRARIIVVMVAHVLQVRLTRLGAPNFENSTLYFLQTAITWYFRNYGLADYIYIFIFLSIVTARN